MTITIDELEQLAGTHATRPATDVKARWRTIVEEANAVGQVIVTNHNRPEAVVMSVDEYTELKARAAKHDPMARIQAKLDRELACLNEPGAGARLLEIFHSTPEEIAAAANAARNGRKQ